MFRNNGVLIADNFLEYVFCEQLAKIRVKIFVDRFKNSDNPEIKEIVDYYQNNKTTAFEKIFPYYYAKKYDENQINLYHDEQDYYVIRNGKKLFLGNAFANEKEVRLYYQRLEIEQDEESPHRYLTDKFYPAKEDVIFDIGGAEGIFSLDIIDNCKKIYIFECDEKWISVLKKTFAQYQDNVEIVNKFVDSFSDETHISIDDFVNQHNLQNDSFFVKIDAEGSELKIIDGAKDTLRKSNVKLAVCAYHRADDEKNIRKVFNGWKIQHSNGYMFFIYDFKMKFPYMRRGVLRIKKHNVIL